MKKFTMAVATASLLSATAFADSCASSFSGFYAGAQAGVNSVSGKQTVDSNVADRNLKNDAGSKAFIGGLFAGYGMGVGSCTYVGGEVYVNFGNNNVNLLTNNTVKQTLKGTYNFGAKVRLGYTVSQQSMIFLGLGMERAKWQVKETIGGNAAVAGRNPGSYKKNKASFAFAPSVGMDMFINKNLFLRGEFTYVLAPSMKVAGGTDTPVAGTNETFKVKATQQRFTLGLGYKF